VEEIDRVRHVEEQNYGVTRKLLGDSAELIEDLARLYEELTQAISKSPSKERSEYIIANSLIMSCRAQLVLGALTLSRLHGPDSYHYSRKAIELCGFAVRILSHPHLAADWRSASESESLYRKYRKKFTTSKLFPTDNPLLHELGERYDRVSKQIHSSIYGIAMSCQFHPVEGGEQLVYDYFPVGHDPQAETVLRFSWLVQTHYKIIEALTEQLQGVLASKRELWEARCRSVASRILHDRRKWSGLLSRFGDAEGVEDAPKE